MCTLARTSPTYLDVSASAVRTLHMPVTTRSPPSMIRVHLRSNNRNTPVARPVGKYVLDQCNHIPLQVRIARIVHLYGHAHSESG